MWLVMTKSQQFDQEKLDNQTKGKLQVIIYQKTILSIFILQNYIFRSSILYAFYPDCKPNFFKGVQNQKTTNSKIQKTNYNLFW